MAEKGLDLQALAKRIEKVEKQNRMIKILGSLTLIITSMIILMGQIPSGSGVPHWSVLSTEELRIVDKQGRPAALIGSDSENSPSLYMGKGSQGNLFLMFNNEGDPLIVLAPKGSKTKEGLILTPKEISFRDKQGKILWAVTPSGTASPMKQ